MQFDKLIRNIVSVKFNGLIDLLLSKDGSANIGTENGTVADHIKNNKNPHGVTKQQIGLGLADNTPDTEKPLSTPQKAAVDAVKADAERKISAVEGSISSINGNISAHSASLSSLAERCGSIENKAAQQEEASAALSQKITGCEKETAANRNNISSLNTSCGELWKSVDSCLGAITAVDAKCSDAAATAAAATTRLNPITGTYEHIDKVLSDLYEFCKNKSPEPPPPPKPTGAPTAEEFDSALITAAYFDSKKLTAEMYDTNGRQFI